MFALQPEPECGRRWRTLALGSLVGAMLHGSVLAATSMLEPRNVSKPPSTIQMRLNVKDARPLEAPVPEPVPVPPPSVEVTPRLPKPKPPRAAQAEARVADPSPSPPPLIVGLTLSSTTSRGDGGRYALGNSTMGAPERVAGPHLGPVVPNVPPNAPSPGREGTSKRATEATMSRAVTPVYPASAKREGIEGVVVVAVTVGAAGEVLSVTVLRGLGHGLDESAMRAVRESVWTPGSLDGRPVRTTRRLNIRFSLQS